MAEEFQGSNVSHTKFVFMGFPELYRYRRLLFLPFFIIYVVVLVGNSLILFVIKTCASLHSPMYILISGMAVIDIIVPTAIIPNMLLSLLFDWNEISLQGCLSQMFFVHLISSFESTILLAMALDRFTAICNPLRYTEIMNSTAFIKLSIFSLIRSGSLMSSLIGLAHPLSFCGSNIIKQCYCEHMALVTLACGNIAKNNAMGLVVAYSIVGFDISVIAFSYIRILNAVLRAATVKERRKAFHTCGTHLIVMLFFYLSGSVTFLAYRLKINIPTDTHTFLGIMYLVFPAGVNPIIYGVRTKEIRNNIVKLFRKRKITVVSSNIATVKLIQAY
ncbi:olfactory receptor 52Z1P-like [Amia ocellicauda]|uniref:olfactory receptor 52Z1P-like n=1 Tax=Amia ocellicauda TaxID=2972642 RepID=UPI0034648414|nr:O52E4 protein [Amia calva]